MISDFNGSLSVAVQAAVAFQSRISQLQAAAFSSRDRPGVDGISNNSASRADSPPAGGANAVAVK